MSDHTKGKLVHCAKGYPHADIKSESGRRVAVTWGISSPKTATAAVVRQKEDRANARRLVAAWNWCEGLSTENLEDNIPAKELALRYNLVLRERDTLLAALCLAEGIAQRVIAATMFDESQIADWRPVVRTAIEAAKA